MQVVDTQLCKTGQAATRRVHEAAAKQPGANELDARGVTATGADAALQRGTSASSESTCHCCCGPAAAWVSGAKELLDLPPHGFAGAIAYTASPEKQQMKERGHMLAPSCALEGALL